MDDVRLQVQTGTATYAEYQAAWDEWAEYVEGVRLEREILGQFPNLKRRDVQSKDGDLGA